MKMSHLAGLVDSRSWGKQEHNESLTHVGPRDGDTVRVTVGLADSKSDGLVVLIQHNGKASQHRGNMPLAVLPSACRGGWEGARTGSEDELLTALLRVPRSALPWALP